MLAAVILSAAGLSYLGFDAYDAEESRARLRAQRALAAVERALAGRAAALLREADLAAGSQEPEEPLHPLLADVFVVSRTGRILLPRTLRFPAAPSPAAERIAAVREFLAEAERVRAETGDPLRAVPFVEEAVEGFEHPDLVAVLEDRTAELYLEAGNAERAEYLTRVLLENLPQARDLDGEPLAPAAHLRLLRILTAGGDRAAIREAGVAFARRLADQAWDLPVYEREVLLERVAELLAPAGLPVEVLDRADLVTRLRAFLIPEALALLAEAEAGEYRHVVRPIGDGLDVMGWTRLELSSGVYVQGYRLSWPGFVEGIREEAAALGDLHEARVEVDTSPKVREGSTADGESIAVETDLGGAFGTEAVRVRVAAPSGLVGLRTLHLAMTTLLTVALVAGTLLSLRAIRRELQTARLRQNFIDNVSHELRTPLTSVRMYAEMLEEEDLDEEKRKGYLAWILRESERLSRLLEDVLDFARLARGEAPLTTEAVLPAEIVREAAARVAPQAEEQGFTLATEIPEDLPLVRADPDAAVRALTNLLQNAIRYSGDSREVGVEGRVEEDRVVLVVWDRGPGVPAEAREHLFTRFYRVPRDARRTKGVGLGLVLAREIARALGGDVVLESTSERGSRFALAIPVEAT
ncbi:MAG: sensor histidine kinase [Planctomycetota bacterium]